MTKCTSHVSCYYYKTTVAVKIDFLGLQCHDALLSGRWTIYQGATSIQQLLQKRTYSSYQVGRVMACAHVFDGQITPTAHRCGVCLFRYLLFCTGLFIFTAMARLELVRLTQWKVNARRRPWHGKMWVNIHPIWVYLYGSFAFFTWTFFALYAACYCWKFCINTSLSLSIMSTNYEVLKNLQLSIPHLVSWMMISVQDPKSGVIPRTLHQLFERLEGQVRMPSWCFTKIGIP